MVCKEKVLLKNLLVFAIGIVFDMLSRLLEN